MSVEAAEVMLDANDTRDSVLQRRARRFARRGEFRKAALALRERAELRNDAASFVALGDMYRRAARTADALRALKHGLYLHRQNGSIGRARTVARMIVRLDPWDAKAVRLSA